MASHFLKNKTMNIQNAQNPIWANAEQTMIDCEIDHPEFGWIPFTANPQDVEAHGRDIYARLVAGEFGAVGAYVAPEQNDPLELCKAQAKARLTDTDWAVLPDVSIQNQAAFVAYRAAVRALYLEPVAEPVWPERPEAIWL